MKTVKYAVQVNIQHGRPVRPVKTLGGTVTLNAGVVHDQVEVSEVLQTMLEAGVHRGSVGHVHLHRDKRLGTLAGSLR